MSDLRVILPMLSLLLLAETFHLALADVGTGSHYSPPYTPSACYGSNQGPFPANNYFAAAGVGIWDNGASCGRRYRVRCLSSSTSRSCISGVTIEVVIVDRAETAVSRPSRPGATFVLSDDAYSAIARLSSPSINIEYSQV